MSKGVLLRPACLALAGDVVVGALLSQIVFWSTPTTTGKSKLRVKRNGVFWIAKTRPEWMAETGLTLQQYRRAILVLKAKGLIEIKRMKFRGLTMSHVRLLQPLVVYNQPTEGAKHTNELMAQNTPSTQWGVSHHSYTESTDSRSPSEIAFANARSKDFMKSSGKDREGKKEREKVHNTEEDHSARKMRAKDILAAHTTGTGTNLAAFWKSRCALVKTGFQQNLTGKEHGQLKQLQTALGHQTRDVITHTIEHWMKFASRAGASAGTAFPTDPHIGFLLKHHGVAVDLFLVSQSSASTLTLPPPADPVQLIATGAEPEEPVKQLTPDELTALLNGLTDP